MWPAHFEEEIRGHMEAAGLVEEQNVFDRRLIVNRKTEQQMHRYESHQHVCHAHTHAHAHAQFQATREVATCACHGPWPPSSVHAAWHTPR